MSKLGYPLTFHPTQTQLSPLPINTSSSSSTSSSPATNNEADVDDQVSVSSEPTPVDTGLIQCICESTEDDGFTIQCDRCLTWQHAYCMNITQNTIPDRYLCDDCTQRLAVTTTITTTASATTDGASHHHQRTLSKHNNNNNNSIKGDSGNTKSALATSTTSTPTTTTTTTTAKRKEDKSNKSSPNGTNGNSRSLSNKSSSTAHGSNSKRSRDRPSLHLDDQSPSTISSSTETSNTPKKPKLSKRISVPKRSLQRNHLMDHTVQDHTKSSKSAATATGSSSLSVKRHNARKHDIKYQPTTTNKIKSKFVYEVIKDTGQRWKQSSHWTSQPWRPASSSQQPSGGPFTVIDQLSLQQSSATHITIRSLTNKQQQQQQQQQQPHYRHHNNRYPSSPICSTTTCKKSRKGAFANTQLYANTFLLEAHGEMLLKSEYKFDAVNDYAILGTPCAHVLFYPTLDLCIDGRRLGNDTRYFRRSCHPNAELRTMVYSSGRTKKEGESSLDDDICQTGDTIIRLGIFTRTTIEPGEEITLGWNWQKGHVSWRKNVEWYRSCTLSSKSRQALEQQQNRTVAHIKPDPLLQQENGQVIKLDQDDDDYQQEEELATRDAIETMLDRFDIEFGDCACNEHDVCLIERLRQEKVVEHKGLNMLPIKTNNNVSSLQHSRQIIVAPSTTTGHSTTEENGDIDVISMSPSGSTTTTNGGSEQQGNKKDHHSDVDDDLDIDGDIDIGDDLPTLPTTTVKVSPSVKPDISSLSSMSSLSGNESADDSEGGNSNVKKRKLESINPSLTTSRSVTPKLSGQLPCKKAWMRHFLKRTMNNEDTGRLEKTTETDPSTNEHIKHETPHVDGHVKKEDGGSDEKKKSTEDTKVYLDVDDGELSDASSASTIPLDEEDWHMRTQPTDPQPPPTTRASSSTQQQQQQQHEKEDPKPTKVKVSLQEYLQSRRAQQETSSTEMTQSIP